MSRFYHPACLFQSFTRARTFTPVVRSCSDIEGFDCLSADEQLMVSHLVSEFVSNSEHRPSTLPTTTTARKQKHTKPHSTIPKPRHQHNLSSPSDLRVIYTNSDQLTSNRREELAADAQLYEPHIICVTEVKPKTGKDRGALDFLIPGYTQHLCNIDSKIGRGIIVYTIIALDNFISRIEPETNPAFPESCWLSLSLKDGDKLLLGCIYRSPTTNNHTETRDLLQSMVLDVGKEFTHIAVVGDLNYPRIKWATGSTPGGQGDEDSKEALFLETTRDCFLTQHVQDVTRVRGHDEPSLLDLVLTNEPGMVSLVSHHPPLDGSDHAVLFFNLHCYVAYAKPQQKFSYDRGDYESIRSHLQGCTWDGDDIDTLWATFAENLTAARDLHIPTYDTSTKPSWKSKSSYSVDEAARKMIREKSRKFNLWMEHRCKPDAESYRKDYTRIRNQVRARLRKSKRLYEQSIADQAKENPKKFFAYCQSKTRTRSGISPLLRDPTDKGSVVNSDQDKSEVLQDQYCSVFTIEGDSPLPQFSQRCDTPLPQIEISVEVVRKKLLALNISKSAGPDGLHPRLLKECAEVIAEPLTKLYAKSLRCGRVPEPWKKSVVSPIFKKGAKNLAANYRPVSLTALLCKVLEDIVRGAIMDHVISHQLLTTRQFGFLKGRSTSLQLLTFLDGVAQKLEAGGGAVDTIYLDYQKAFDTVPHQRLLQKLEAYGITGTTLLWIKSFLSGRTQRVSVNGSLSGERVVISGVPQGSVLGPLLFLLYINDIVDGLETSLFLFADDSKLSNHISGQADIDTLQRDLVQLERWSDDWLLRFHPDKCHVLSLGKFDDIPCWAFEYRLCGHTLEHVFEERDLGVTVDHELTFEAHIDSKVNTANAFLGLVRRNFVYLDTSTLTKLFVAFVRPQLEYAHAVWNPNRKGLISKIERVQMRALSLVPELKDLPYEEQLRHAGLTTLAFRRLRGDMVEAYKHFHVYERQILCESFKVNPRHSHKLFQTHSSSPLRDRLFYHRIQELWNNLPRDIQSAVSLNSFKNKIDAHWKHLDLKFDFGAGLPTLRNHIEPPKSSRAG